MEPDANRWFAIRDENYPFKIIGFLLLYKTYVNPGPITIAQPPTLSVLDFNSEQEPQRVPIMRYTIELQWFYRDKRSSPELSIINTHPIEEWRKITNFIEAVNNVGQHLVEAPTTI